MYASNQLMFPHSVIASLQDLRGPKWAALVGRIATLGESDEECLALMLTMIRLNGCIVCETDSYRAMRGCGACAVQTLRRYKGTDEELLAAYAVALDDVRRYQVRNGKGRTVSV
jgi:hypothetical protein